jgi:hypothetical protein
MSSLHVMSAEDLLFAMIALGGLLAIVQFRAELMERRRQRRRAETSSTQGQSDSLLEPKTNKASGTDLAAVAAEEEI